MESICEKPDHDAAKDVRQVNECDREGGHEVAGAQASGITGKIDGWQEVSEGLHHIAELIDDVHLVV